MATWESFQNENESLMRELGANGVYLNQIWLQSRCECEYCGMRLLDSPQNYGGAESDHILPQFRYPKLVNKLSNYAMACASCHKLKGRFDPGEEDMRFRDLDDLNDQDRQHLIRRVQHHLAPLRRKQDEDIENIKVILARHSPRT